MLGPVLLALLRLLPAVAAPPRCPFCPSPRTVQVVGAAGGELVGGTDGKPSVAATVRAAQDEGLNALGVDAISCDQLARLKQALTMTDGGDFHIVTTGLVCTLRFCVADWRQRCTDH